ncbi:hypothetical protein [Pseudooceanicola nanhaiensis]|uniref:hypothetical protein n=1 Tax=Pseudooceanicola nanhaiensis TaxID=375761 RepID=UPI001CD78FB5|nr:hypothetical protein [Pseudooceanicola nanhaiensis]MCA0922442.1 hypothetical protein [Pseudooceanicola nanhaiensis]
MISNEYRHFMGVSVFTGHARLPDPQARDPVVPAVVMLLAAPIAMALLLAETHLLGWAWSTVGLLYVAKATLLPLGLFLAISARSLREK